MKSNSAAAAYEFESLVAELLEALGFTNVINVGRTGDYGVDLQATFPVKSPTGEIVPHLWLVDVKHYGNQDRLSSPAVAQLVGMLQARPRGKALIVTSGNLTSAAKEYVNKFNATGGDLEIWDRETLSSLLSRFPHLQTKYEGLISSFPKSLSAPYAKKDVDLVTRLSNCLLGKPGWNQFESICIDILTEVFVPPLKAPKPQARTLDGLERRDALFSLRNVEGGWEKIRQEFEAKFLLCEFKNYSEPFTKDEVNQTRNYLRDTIGKIGIIFSRKGPDDGALKMRNSIYSQERKVILFFDESRLIELLRLKRAGQNPLDLIQDALDDFYISHE